MKRWVATATMVLGLLGISMAPAYADPTNTEPLTITCDGTTYTAVMVLESEHVMWPPALVTTSNQALIPFSFEFTLTNLATGDIVSRNRSAGSRPSGSRPRPAPSGRPSPRTG